MLYTCVKVTSGCPDDPNIEYFTSEGLNWVQFVCWAIDFYVQDAVGRVFSLFCYRLFILKIYSLVGNIKMT